MQEFDLSKLPKECPACGDASPPFMGKGGVLVKLNEVRVDHIKHKIEFDANDVKAGKLLQESIALDNEDKIFLANKIWCDNCGHVVMDSDV